MARKKRKSLERKNESSCCRIESLINVDERGQMVFPKELRDKANIRTGDKLALVSWEKNGEICCMVLIKAEDFTDIVKGLLGPLMKGMVETSNIPSTQDPHVGAV